jgi:hypothetical protein
MEIFIKFNEILFSYMVFLFSIFSFYNFNIFEEDNQLKDLK